MEIESCREGQRVRLSKTTEKKPPAGGIKGALFLLGIDAVEQWAALVTDPIVEKIWSILLREGVSFRSRMISPPNAHRWLMCF